MSPTRKRTLGAMLSLVSFVIARAVLLGLSIVSCSEGRPPYLADTSSSTSRTGAGGASVEPCEGPPPPDSADYCGNEVVPILTDRPNVYFVLDGSGSMRDEFEATKVSKLLNAKFAIRDLLIEIGHRIRYGAAVFPDTDGEVCALGTQVFPTSAGDPLLCNGNAEGPVLRRFLDSIGFRRADGGTPTAESLAALAPMLKTLGGDTSIVLITDGAPNCNAEARCELDGCIPNLERHFLGDRVCGEEVDCCDMALLGPNAHRNCVDGVQSEAVLQELAEAQIRTFVVGMPGSEVYADVLDRMAQAGGTARLDAQTKYYSVSDTQDLSRSLFAIGNEVSLSCRVRLQTAPPEPQLLNVYLDNRPVEQDDTAGWSYAGAAVIELHGEACNMLKGGSISQVQVVSGCPTIIK